MTLDEFLTHVEVVSDEKAETASYVVCMPKTSEALFDDDQFAVCVICEVAIRHRPYMPTTPLKICIDCLGKVQKAKTH